MGPRNQAKAKAKTPALKINTKAKAFNALNKEWVETGLQSLLQKYSSDV